MEPPQKESSPIQAQLGLWDAVSIIIGIVIGAGIYETPPLIFSNVHGPWEGLGVWALGGLLSLVGAFCYAELATTYPRSGGDYVYLTRAFGPWMGFLFGWAQLVVIRTGNIGMMAYVFADYATRLWDFGKGDPRSLTEAQVAFLYAAAAVAILSVLNLLGVVFGKGTQNILTAAKILGLGGILVAAIFSPATSSAATVAPSGVSFGLAMVLVLYTYGGWNDAALVAAEQRNPRRNIPLALVLGTVAITVIYVLVNGAYLLSLGFDGARQSKAVAADVLNRALGETGSKAISVLVMVSALGAINGMIFTGSRVYSMLGKEYSLFAWLGWWHRGLGSPLWSLVAQLAIILAMLAAVGTETGNALLGLVGLAPAHLEPRSGFSSLLNCTAPAFWIFFLLTGLSLFVLRFKDQTIERPFTVPLYPIFPLVFCATCAYMFYSAAAYAGPLALLPGILVLAGLIFYGLSRRQASAETHFP
ncbi:MAG TPA: amino acid permease [Gemmataceae bacterium]|nr:amino acid permease [Gemmataceae bacterium]